MVNDITEGYTGVRLREQLAQAAYCLAPNKEQVEKSIKVDNSVFEQCLMGMPEHHKNFNRKRGILRTYYKPFWTENEGNLGKTYHHGVVHIVNRDSEVNSTYTLNSFVINNFEQVLQHALKIKGHRLISIYGDFSGNVEAELTPQRTEFDSD